MTRTPMAMSHADLVEAGKMIAQSEMFGKINPASGYMIAALCYQEGISYLEFSEVYNWMHGSPSMKADAMLAKFCDMGGQYRVVTRTAEKAEISVTYEGQTSTYSITWEEVKDEPFTQDKTGKTKSNYATPRKRMQSLWSRAVSDAVHTICPQACKGSYTAEEAETFLYGEDAPQKPPQAPTNTPEAVRRAEHVVDAMQGSVVDFTRCPDGFGVFAGLSWSDIETDMLEAAFDSDNPEITEGHKTAIMAVIEERSKK